MSTVIIRNGKIYMERGRFAEALMIEGGIITHAGSEADIMTRATAADFVYDCGGRTVIPGLNDSHMHIIEFAEAVHKVRIDDVRSADELVARCRRFIAEHPDRVANGLHAAGWNQELFTGDKRIPDRSDLDRISTDIPVMLERVCSHIAAVNTRLIETLGMDDDMTLYHDCNYLRNSSGTPTGLLRGNACMHAREAIPDFTLDEKRRFLVNAMNVAASMGLTSVQSNDIGPDLPDKRGALRMIKSIYDSGEAPLRYHYQMYFDTPDEFSGFIREGLILPSGPPDINDMWLTTGPLKLYKDGSLGAGTALMKDGYAGNKDNKGLRWLSSEDMDRFCAIAGDAGIQVITHAIGNQAIEEAIDSYEKIFSGGCNTLRHGIVHCQITDRDLIKRLRDSDKLVFAQPVFIDADMHIAEKLCGRELASTSYAFGTMLREGIHLSYGTDCPVETCDPFLNIYEAVTRKDSCSRPESGYYPEEAVDVETAIDAYTTGSAYAQFAENVKGRLKQGYVADLVVLDRDIFTVSHDEIKDIRPMMTMTGGRIVYQR